MDYPNAENVAKTSADAVTESGKASSAALRDLATAYQELASKNGRNPTVAMQALAAVNKPTEFIDPRQRLIEEESRPPSAIAITSPN